MRPAVIVLLAAVAAGGWWMTRGGRSAGPEMEQAMATGGRDFGLAINPSDLAAMPPEQRQALEAAAREATSPEDLERRLGEIARQMESQAALSAPGVPPARQYALEDHDARYHRLSLQGFRIRVARDLVARDEAAAMAALTAIDRQLEDIARALPAARLASLRLVPIWLELKVPGMEVPAYHSTAGWLREKGLNTDKADSVDIPDAHAFLMNVGAQPSMLLHELAHAYHLRALGEENEDIRRAYRNAMAAGLYAQVRNFAGETVPAYARTNEKEYFAEITEAYYGRNDFFPFTRDDLRTYDPGGYALVEALWVKR